MNSCIGAYLSLPSIDAVSVFASWSNPCSGCLCLWELFLVCSVLSLSVSQGAADISLNHFLDPLSWPALLLLSVHSQPVHQSLSLDPLCVVVACFRDRQRFWGL